MDVCCLPTPASRSVAGLYPARSRAENVALIKAVLNAAGPQELDRARAAVSAAMHPSLLSELDWMEIAVPEAQRGGACSFVDGFFTHHLPGILALRRAELDLPDAELAREVAGNLDFYRGALGDDRQPLQALGAGLHARIAALAGSVSGPPADALERRCETLRPAVQSMLRMVGDPDWLPRVVERELVNATALALDRTSSRLRAKRWLRDRGGRLTLGPGSDAATGDGLHALRARLREWGESAAAAGLLDIAALCQCLDEQLDATTPSRPGLFGGELAGGRGPCGRCAMMYASTAIVSFDPTCPGLFRGDDGLVSLPLDFNVSACPFCGEEQRSDTPCLFYSPQRGQVIYNFPRLGQFGEDEARDVHRPMLAALRERLMARLGADGARRFESAREELTYAMPQFLLAVQMGTTVREEHVCLVVRSLFDDGGLLVDPTKGVMLELTRAERAGYGGREYSPSAGDLQAEEGETPSAASTGSTNVATTGAGMHAALQAFAAGDYAHARDILAAMVQANPGDHVLRRNLAAALFKLGDRAAATRALQGEATWNPTH